MRSEQEIIRECQAVSDALYETREVGLPMSQALDAAHEKALKAATRDAAMAILRQCWDGMQESLAVVQRAHPGAMEYFVKIKNRIKRQIEVQFLEALEDLLEA